jgi:formate dehydrogenase gamma subunit
VPKPPVRQLGRTAGSGFQRVGTWANETLQAEERVLEPDARGHKRILRQPAINRLVHWLVALSTFSLFFSGFGQMPLYKRYMLSDLPGLAWTADYGVTLLLHYLGAGVLMFALSFHLVYHGLLRRAFGFMPRRGDLRESAQIVRAMVTGGAEPPSAKYLAEQRLAYAAIGGTLLVIVLTGLVKVAKNLPGVGLPEVAITASTLLHNVAAIVLLLLIVAHLAAFLVPANRKLVGAMFHGTVDRDYVEHRHQLWYRELTTRTSESSDVGEPASVTPSPPAVEQRPQLGSSVLDSR